MKKEKQRSMILDSPWDFLTQERITVTFAAAVAVFLGGMRAVPHPPPGDVIKIYGWLGVSTHVSGVELRKLITCRYIPGVVAI